MVYLVIALCIAVFAAVFLGVRLIFLKRALRRSAVDLNEINDSVTENNVLRLPAPDKDMAALLSVVNGTLSAVRKERISYALREKEFRSQIECISHDLRTPLTVIIGYLKLMPERDDTSEVILRKALSMQKLVSAFYDYSRIISGDYPLKLDSTDMRRVVLETFADNCVIFENKGLSVEAQFDDDPVIILADGGALERIAINLLQNASRYARSLFKITFSIDGGRALAKFINDADDMSEDTLLHIFDRFYMADGSRTAGGTGLGLTIARDLAEQMGGSLTAVMEQSGDRRLLCFELSFPTEG